MEYPYKIKCRGCGEFMRSSNPSKHNRHKACIKPKKKYSAKFQRIRLNIAVRDNYMCKLCGENVMRDDITQPMAPIHHIDGNHRNNKVTNLVQLCNKCHGQLHAHGLKKIQVKEIKIPQYQNVVLEKPKVLFKNINP